MSSRATTASNVTARPTASLPPGFGKAMSRASKITTGSNKADEYDVALASARIAPAASIQTVASCRSPARTTSQAAIEIRNSDMAS